MKKHYLSFAIIAAVMGLASCGNETDDVDVQSADNGNKVENNIPADVQKAVITFRAGYFSKLHFFKGIITDSLHFFKGINAHLLHFSKGIITQR